MKYLILAFLVLLPRLSSAETRVFAGEYIVTRRADVPGPRLRAASRGQNYEVIQTRSAVYANGRRSSVPYASQADECAELKASDSTIEACTPNFELRAATVPNDTYYNDLWGLKNSWMHVDIDAETAWNYTTGSDDVVVAVIDSGIDYNHPELVSNMWRNPGETPGDGIDNDGNGYVDDVHGINAADASGDPMDENGHGTHVAGTIGASGNNGIGIVGVNWRVKLIGARFLDADGGGSLADELKAIEYLIALKQRGVNLVAINASYGSTGTCEACRPTYQQLHASGILMAVAAGNDSSDNDVIPTYPGNMSFDNLISVGAIDERGEQAYFSNYGYNSVHIHAPGHNIYSLAPGGEYAELSGTSMAAPHVAGAIALVKAFRPNLTGQEIRSALLGNTLPLASLQGANGTGASLNIGRTLQTLAAIGENPGDEPSQQPPPQVPSESSRFSLLAGGAGNWNPRVKAGSSTVVHIARQSVAGKSDEAQDVAFLAMGFDGKWCSTILPVPADAKHGTFLQGRFGQINRSINVALVVLKNGGEMTDFKVLTVQPKKSQGRNNHSAICASFFQSLYLYDPWENE